MSLPTVPVPVAGVTLHLAAGKHEPFYADLAAGRWEPDTFDILKAHLDRQTLYIDIGGWIGVTPFYAAHFAARVVAVEPDPAAFAILEGIRDQNAGDVTLVRAAVAAESGEAVLHAVKRWGSSMSTLLEGAARDTGEAVAVRSLEFKSLIQDFAARNSDLAKILIKIDIEGGEYPIMQSLRRLDPARLRGVLLAVHPQIYFRGLKGPLRRLRCAWATWRLLGAVPLAHATDPATGRRFGRLGYVVADVLLGRPIKGTNVLFTSPEQRAS